MSRARVHLRRRVAYRCSAYPSSMGRPPSIVNSIVNSGNQNYFRLSRARAINDKIKKRKDGPACPWSVTSSLRGALRVPFACPPLRSSSLAHIFGNFCPKRTASISFWGFSSTGSSNLGLFFRLEQNFWWPTHLDVLALRINIEELDELHFFSCQRGSFARQYISR